MEHLTESVISTDEPTEGSVAEETLSPAEETAPALDESAPADEYPLPPAEEIGKEAAPVDYEAIAAEDLRELRRLVPSLRISHIGELPRADRYAQLRDLGLSVEEAYRAACYMPAAPTSYDNRSHLHSAVPRGAAGNPAMMTAAEMRAAKDLFEDLSESEIQKLYVKCRS